MRFERFEKKAREAYASIPPEYKEGVDGLVVSPEAHRHPDLEDVYTLGECITESYPSEWVGPETTRSVVVLYHGSFRALARLDPEFDWEGELWETLTHELRHHLEGLADEDDLEGVDYVMDEGYKREEGLDFDPWYYRHGERLGGGVYRAEEHVFIEQAWTAANFEATDEIAFRWRDETWAIPKPAILGDIHFVWIDGVDLPGGTLQLVLTRRRSWREGLGELFRRSDRRLELWESEATASRRPESPPASDADG